MASGGVQITRDGVPALLKAIQDLTHQQVLVGIPGDASSRQSGSITNVSLGFIHEFGSPAQNIPARPFLRPGINNAIPQIVATLKAGAIKAIAFPIDPQAPMKVLMSVGMIAQRSVQQVITDGIAPPLATSTLRGRIRNRTSVAGAQAELAHRASGGSPGLDLAKPLIASGQLRRAIQFVIRPVR